MSIALFLCRQRHRARMLYLAAAVSVFAAAPAPAQDYQPEPGTGRHAHALAHAKHHMVAAAEPAAVAAGLEILRAGGSAADAAVAVQLVLNLVEPQSSGIGGGAFALYYDADSKAVTSYDGRETAPAAATEKLFLTDDGKPMDFFAAVVGGRSVGTPGTVALLAALHKRHGRLPWPRLFAPAITLAEHGFTVSPRLAALLRGKAGERLRTYAPAAAYFFPDGKPLAAGTVVVNKRFAATLRAIAKAGASAFYSGPIARDIVATVRGAAGNPGLLAEADLAAYRAIERPPVCPIYRTYRVCGMGPPSSGGLTVGQILGLLEPFDLPALGPDNVESWHLLTEASKLAFADRNRYMADADFVGVPVEGLLDRTYLARRARLIARDRAAPPPVAAGTPPHGPTKRTPDTSNGRPGTSHMAIVDDAGNALSMTTTIEGAFGSQLIVRGFLLNNELTDFSFVPARDGVPVANRVEPGKRPRSSMAPTIVFDGNGKLKLLVGSPGGSRIIGYVAQTLIAVLDWGLDIQAAIDLGHVVNRNGATELEAGSDAARWQAPLAALGHEVRVRELNSGLQGITVGPDGLAGGADPRREGIARGD